MCVSRKCLPWNPFPPRAGPVPAGGVPGGGGVRGRAAGRAVAVRAPLLGLQQPGAHVLHRHRLQQPLPGARRWVGGPSGRVLFENRHALYFFFFLITHLFLPIKYISLFRIKDTVSDILSVLLNFIANYDCKNENIPPYCI